MHDEPPVWQRIHASIGENCARGGLDIVHAFGVPRERSPASELAHSAAPDFGCSRGLGLLIGNTRALWPAFQRELERDASLEADTDPLDRYVVGIVERARAKISIPSVAQFAHVARPQPLPIQRIAEEVGLAHLSPSHLSIHPEHGPWIALRAVLLFDVEGPAPLPPPPDPCTGCAKPCLGALEAALASASGNAGTVDVVSHWREWLRVRDCCPEGGSSRYGDDQIAYHYGRDRRWLGSRQR